ncbi:MAG: hypothetical protein ACR2ML_06400 [Solirubrobacteraceae bacterium]
MAASGHEDPELWALREGVAALERERDEMRTRTEVVAARARVRGRTLTRLNVDLNALMRTPTATRVRAGLRGLRAVLRWWRRRVSKPLRALLRG